MERPGPAPGRAVDARVIAALAAVYLVWSSTYLAMQLVVAEIPPFAMGALRFTAAGSIMLAVATARGAPWPNARAWLNAAPVGLLLFLGANGCVATAETAVSSGGAAVVSATMPLWVGVLGAAVGVRPTRREWLSLGVGFVGVVVLMRGPSLSGPPLEIACVIASPILWACGSLLARRVPPLPGPHAGLTGTALQLLCGGAGFMVAALVSGQRLPAHPSAQAWLALAYLVVFGSLVGFTSYAFLLRRARPAVATSYAYVNPVLAVLIGAALHGESLGWTTAVANALIVGGLLLVLVRRPSGRGARREP